MLRHNSPFKAPLDTWNDAPMHQSILIQVLKSIGEQGRRKLNNRVKQEVYHYLSDTLVIRLLIVVF